MEISRQEIENKLDFNRYMATMYYQLRSLEIQKSNGDSVSFFDQYDSNVSEQTKQDIQSLLTQYLKNCDKYETILDVWNSNVTIKLPVDYKYEGYIDPKYQWITHSNIHWYYNGSDYYFIEQMYDDIFFVYKYEFDPESVSDSGIIINHFSVLKTAKKFVKNISKG